MRLLREYIRELLMETDSRVIHRVIPKFDVNAENPMDKAATKDINNLFRVFHISKDVLGNTSMHGRKKDDQPGFTFTPRVTDNPTKDTDGNTVEDDFTPRVSVGPTIEKCFEALNMLQGGSGYLYAAGGAAPGGDVKVFDLQDRFENCITKLSSGDNRFGEMFKFQKYLMSKFNEEEAARWIQSGVDAPSDLPDEYEIDWMGCVPDAMQTEEDWLLEPTTLMFIGHVGQGMESMKLSPGASALLQKLGFTLDIEDYREKK